MKEITLTKGFVAKVDDEDFEWLNQWRWTAFERTDHHIYAVRSAYDKETGKSTTIRMHRLIMGVTDPKVFIDHEDTDTLNNQKYNLRETTNSQNQMNCVSRIGVSKHKGVSFNKNSGKWTARIMKEGKRKSLGSFNDETQAMIAYNDAAKILFNNFARLNK